MKRGRKNKFITRQVFNGPREIDKNIAIVQGRIKELDMLPQIEKLVRLVGLLQGPFVIVAVKDASLGLDMSIFQSRSQELHLVAKLGDLLEYTSIAARIMRQDGAVEFLRSKAWLAPAEK